MKRLLLLAVASLLSSSFVFPAVALESTPVDDYVANRNEPSIEEKLESLANARPDRDDADWGWEKISKKYNIKNVKILEAIVRLDRAPVESSIEKGNFKSTSEVRFYDCGFVVNGVGGQCRQIYTPIFVSEVFRPLSQPYYKGVRAQTRKRGVKDNHPVGVVTAWCHRDSEDASGKNFSRCPDYVNTTKEFGKWQ